jgi:hypothetical protein
VHDIEAVAHPPAVEYPQDTPETVPATVSIVTADAESQEPDDTGVVKVATHVAGSTVRVTGTN